MLPAVVWGRVVGCVRKLLKEKAEVAQHQGREQGLGADRRAWLVRGGVGAQGQIQKGEGQGRVRTQQG